MGLLRTFYKNALINSQLSLYTVEMKNTRGCWAGGRRVSVNYGTSLSGYGKPLSLPQIRIKRKEEEGSLEDSKKRQRTEDPERTHYVVFYFHQFYNLFHGFSSLKAKSKHFSVLCNIYPY